MMTGFGFGYGAALMMLLMLLFWVFVVAGVVWLVLAAGRAQQAPFDGPRGSAIRTLEERLARGEIDVEEFKARRAALEGATR